MKMNKFGAMAIGLSVLLLWACTEVHVRLSPRAPIGTGEPAHLPPKEPITLAELIARQKERGQQRDRDRQSDTSGQVQTPTSRSLCDSPGKLRDEVRPYNQEAAGWCWATSAQVVLEFHKVTNGQCDWVNGSLSRADCCGVREFLAPLNRWFTDTPSACDQGGWPHWVFASSEFDYERLMAPRISDPTEWAAYFDALKTQLCQNGPFISVIRWAEGGKHSQVVRAIDDVLRVVEVNDHRDADFNTQPFEEFIGSNGSDPYGEFGHAQEMFYVELQRR